MKILCSIPFKIFLAFILILNLYLGDDIYPSIKLESKSDVITIIENIKAYAKKDDSDLKNNDSDYNTSASNDIQINNDTKVNDDVQINDSEKTTDSSSIRNEINLLISDYLKYFATAVNSGNYSYIETYILPDSPLDTMQRSFLENIRDKNIKENFLDYELIDMAVNENKHEIIITVSETYDITTNAGSKTKDFINKYTINYDINSGRYLLSELLTNE